MSITTIYTKNLTDPLFDWVGDAWDATGGKVVHAVASHACGLAKALSVGAIALGFVAVGLATAGFGDAALVAILAGTGASAGELGLGVYMHSRGHTLSGAAGVTLGLTGLATWGALADSAVTEGMSPLAVNLTGGFSNAIRASAGAGISGASGGGC